MRLCNQHQQNRFKQFLGVLLLMFSLSGVLGNSDAQARDLHGRLGLGYNSSWANSHPQTVGGVPAISLKWGLTKGVALGFSFGITTASPSNSVTALKFYKNFFYETNLNFYFMLGGGLVSAAGTSGAEFVTGFGSEFFIPGLESIGFSFEFGASFNNISGSFALRTLGVGLFNAGIHFYI